MPVKQNIELMQRWFQEVWNEGRIETVHELFAADGVAIGQAGPQALLRGPQEFVPFVERIRGALALMGHCPRASGTRHSRLTRQHLHRLVFMPDVCAESTST